MTPHTLSTEVDHADQSIQLEAEIRKSALRVIQHMNDDHEDSLIAYVLAFATGVEEVGQTESEKTSSEMLLQKILSGESAITRAKLTQVDAKGFLLEVSIDCDSNRRSSTSIISNVRVPYDRKIQKARELHRIAVDMHHKAFDKLGVLYKAKNGYYQQALKMVGLQTFKKLKRNQNGAMIASCLTMVTVAGYVFLARGNTSRCKKSINTAK